MHKTLIIYGHPYYQHSYSNRAILTALVNAAPDAEIVNLMELYPDYNIDSDKEQARIAGCDTIVFQFPVWWYGMPSILQRYVEQVFTHGYAYGSTGKALAGKRLILSFTAGAPEDAYTSAGAQQHTMREYFQPIYAMARLCSLGVPAEVGSYGMMYIDPADTAHNDQVLRRAQDHAERLVRIIRQA